MAFVGIGKWKLGIGGMKIQGIGVWRLGNENTEKCTLKTM